MLIGTFLISINISIHVHVCKLMLNAFIENKMYCCSFHFVNFIHVIPQLNFRRKILLECSIKEFGVLTTCTFISSFSVTVTPGNGLMTAAADGVNIQQ